MSVEFLKALFSDKALTFDEFAKAVADSKDIKHANLADGQYVDKQKLDDKAGELKLTGVELVTVWHASFSRLSCAIF